MSPGTNLESWSKEAMYSDVRVAGSGETGYLSASIYFSVQRGTLVRYST